MFHPDRRPRSTIVSDKNDSTDAASARFICGKATRTHVLPMHNICGLSRMQHGPSRIQPSVQCLRLQCRVNSWLQQLVVMLTPVPLVDAGYCSQRAVQQGLRTPRQRSRLSHRAWPSRSGRTRQGSSSRCRRLTTSRCSTAGFARGIHVWLGPHLVGLCRQCIGLFACWPHAAGTQYLQSQGSDGEQSTHLVLLLLYRAKSHRTYLPKPSHLPVHRRSLCRRARRCWTSSRTAASASSGQARSVHVAQTSSGLRSRWPSRKD